MSRAYHSIRLIVGLFVVAAWLLGVAPEATSALLGYERFIVGGDPDGTPSDSPADRVVANTDITSPWAAVGSVEVYWPGTGTFGGSGTPITRSHILTAGHLVDLDDTGDIDVDPGNVAFHLNYGMNDSHVITASSLAIHPDFTGFNSPSINDDLAIITLSSPLPSEVPVYDIFRGTLFGGETLSMVGYGRSGNGLDGYTTDSSFTVKRAGENTVDLFIEDDEGMGPDEIFGFDFDFPDDSYPGFANFTGGTSLGNDKEAQLGPGDSGSPCFIYHNGEWKVAGVNTFGARFIVFNRFGWPIGYGPEPPLFGSAGGGIMVSPYAGWIDGVAIPVPGAIWLLGSALLALVGLKRKFKRK